MTPWLLIAVSAAYFYTGVEQGIKVNLWWLGMWASYALANLFYLKATGNL